MSLHKGEVKAWSHHRVKLKTSGPGVLAQLFLAPVWSHKSRVHCMASDGKGVTGPRKSFRQRLEEMAEYGASGMPDGEGRREEGYRAPFRGPCMPGLGTGLDFPGDSPKGF